MEITVFLDVTQCSLVEESNRHSHSCEKLKIHIVIFCVEDTLCNIHLYHPEDVDAKFLRDVVKLLPDFVASHSKQYKSSRKF
jgi:hypothetical protein